MLPYYWFVSPWQCFTGLQVIIHHENEVAHLHSVWPPLICQAQLQTHGLTPSSQLAETFDTLPKSTDREQCDKRPPKYHCLVSWNDNGQSYFSRGCYIESSVISK